MPRQLPAQKALFEKPSRSPSLAAQAQTTILEAEKPDAVVFLGDMVTGFEWFLGGKQQDGWFEGLWQQLTKPVVEAGVPYAVALG